MDILEPEFWLRTAPVVSITVIIMGIGLYAGYRSRDDHVRNLKEWIEQLLK